MVRQGTPIGMRSDSDHEALCGFVRDACAVNYADAAAMLAALIKRTGASDRELLLAALDVLRELTAAQRETGAA